MSTGTSAQEIDFDSSQAQFKCESSKCSNITNSKECSVFKVSGTNRVKRVCLECSKNKYGPRAAATALRKTALKPTIESMPPPGLSAGSMAPPPVQHSFGFFANTPLGYYRSPPSQPDPAMIAQSVNAAHRPNPIRGQERSTSLPQSYGPKINIYSPSPTPTPHPGARQRASGYTSTHDLYRSEEARFQAMAYAASGDTITFELAIGFFDKGKASYLKELENVFRDHTTHDSVHQLIAELRKEALAKLKRWIDDTTGCRDFPYTIEPSKIRIQDRTDCQAASIGTDLSGHKNPTQFGYLRQYGLVPDKKKPGNPMIWKVPRTRRIKFAAIVESSEWERMNQVITTYEVNGKLPKVSAIAPEPLWSSTQSSSIASHKQSESSGDFPENSAMSTGTSNSKQERSQSLAEPTTPPQTKRTPVWQSPERTDIRNILAQGGKAVSSRFVYSRVQLYGLSPIPIIDFTTVIKEPKLAHWNYERYCVSGIYTLDVDLREGQQLGEGAMKTAHDGKLTGSHLQVINNSKILQRLATGQPICVKYFFRMVAGNEGKTLRGRFQGSYEFSKICIEANIHFWACMLMQMVYTYIDSRCAAKDSPPPPANVPQFSYVAAAVCTTAKENMIPYHSFLIEERIMIPDDAHFIKWIHNGSPNPVSSIDRNHPEYDKAQFLSAVQHLQYVKTSGSVYVADFQGYGYQLTDAQIMTSPDLADQAGGKELFGDGNVPSAFTKFPHLHICNHWCHWLALEPFTHNLEEGETLDK